VPSVLEEVACFLLPVTLLAVEIELAIIELIEQVQADARVVAIGFHDVLVEDLATLGIPQRVAALGALVVGVRVLVPLRRWRLCWRGL